MKIDPFSNIGHLKLELFTNGLKIDSSCDIKNDGRPVLRTRGGLGSGLEIILPGSYYVNVPIEEFFVKDSPYTLKKENGNYFIYKRASKVTKVILPKRPNFYNKKTSSGKLMSKIGVMQGTYLAIYATSICKFWIMSPKKNCKFCSVGLNLGKTEDLEKSVQEVLETVEEARKEQNITFVHFNSGFNYGKEIEDIVPYIKTIKERTGLLVGVQVSPAKNLRDYDYLKKLGVDHISICLEFYNPKEFARLCPGKKEFLGREKFLKSIEYASKVFGKGRVAGEIIVGLEPIKDTINAIEEFAQYGAVSTICVFRPTVGTDLEKVRPPKSENVAEAFKKMYEVCMEYNIPIDIAPNIKVSLVILPYEGKFFAETNLRQKLFSYKMSFLKAIFYLYFLSRINIKRLMNYFKQ